MALGRTVQELTASMSSTEYADWLEYAAQEPWGEARSDLRSAIVACTVARSQGARCEVQDFLPDFGRAEAPPTAADIRRRFAGMR